MGINRTLWARACDVMGREYAAVAMAIVSTRPEGHFTSGPGGYFAGMLRKFEKNPQDLCLARTLWRLKDATWGAQGHNKSFDPAITSGRGFAPVGSVLRYRELAPPPPARRALPAPADRPVSRSGGAWQPSQELCDIEERINAMLANPEDGEKR